MPSQSKQRKGKIGHFWVLSVKQGTHELTALLVFFLATFFLHMVKTGKFYVTHFYLIDAEIF